MIKRKKAGHWYAVQRYNGFDQGDQPALKEKWFPLQNARGETLTVDTPLRTVEQTLRTLELELHRKPQSERVVDLRTDAACDDFLRSKEHSVRAGTMRSYGL